MLEIARGNLDIKLEKEKDDKIGEIIDSIHTVAESINEVVDEQKLLTAAATEGKLDIRGDVGKFKGAFAAIIQGVNSTLDAITKPVKEIEAAMKRMAVNDFTTTVKGDYKGEFEKLKKNINSVFVGLQRLQNALKKISEGDLSKLENYKKRGKFSENDELIPAFFSMIESINNLVNQIS